MHQLDLFTLKPLLEIGKVYRFFYGWKNESSVDYYIANMDYKGDPWDQYGSITYFVICENKHASMRESIHDCGCYIWQSGSRKIEPHYRTASTKYYELTGDDLIEFVSKLRDKSIREKFGLPLHPCWDRFLGRIVK